MFEGRLDAEVKQQERLDVAEEEEFIREELSEKYIVKMLYRQNNRKFKEKYLKKLERDWWKWKSVSLEEKH